mgnify:CR=1 FL=1
MIKKQILLFGVFVLFVNMIVLSASAVRAEGVSPLVEATKPPTLERATGPLQKYVVAAMADVLGLKEDELQKRLDAGERMWDIAKSLGISTTDFKTKMDEAFNKAIDAALADKAITQEQANWLKQRTQWLETEPSFGFRNGYMEQALEKVLGLKWEDVMSRIKGGETFTDILKKQGISEDEFKTKVIETATQLINQAVKDGKLTQDQANRMIENLKNRPMWNFVNPRLGGFRPQGGRPDGGPNGMRGRNGKPGGPGFQGTPPSTN